MIPEVGLKGRDLGELDKKNVRLRIYLHPIVLFHSSFILSCSLRRYMSAKLKKSEDA